MLRYRMSDLINEIRLRGGFRGGFRLGLGLGIRILPVRGCGWSRKSSSCLGRCGPASVDRERGVDWGQGLRVEGRALGLKVRVETAGLIGAAHGSDGAGQSLWTGY